MKIWILKSHGIHGCLVDIPCHGFPYQSGSISHPHFLDQVKAVGFYSTKTDEKFVMLTRLSQARKSLRGKKMQDIMNLEENEAH